MMLSKNTKYNVPEKLLLLSVFVSPLRCYGFVVGGINFSLFRIAGLLMILMYIIKNDFRIRYNNQSILILLISLISIFQGIYSPSISGSRSNYFSVTFGFLWIYFAFHIISDNRLLKHSVLDTFVYSSVFPLGLGVYQFIMHQRTGRVPSLPFQFLVATEGKTGMTYNVYVRITSCFGDPAYFSTFIVVLFFICLQTIISNEELQLNRRSVIVRAFLLLLCIIETLMAISVSGLVGILSGLVLVLVLNGSKIKNFGRIILIGMLMCIALFVYLNRTDFVLIDTLLFKINTSSQSSLNLYGRSSYIKNALDVFLRYPLTGGGFGSLSINNRTFSSAHSSLLTVLGQQGIIVFIMHIILLFVFPINSYRMASNSYDKEYGKTAIIALYSVVILSLAYDTLYTMDVCYVAIAIALATAIRNQKIEEHL